METSSPLVKEKPRLFYAGRCGKCRVLSQLVVWFSFQQIERIPIESEIANQFYQQHPEARGQLILFHSTFQTGKYPIGRWVYVAVPWLILKLWFVLSLLSIKNRLNLSENEPSPSDSSLSKENYGE
ncbi:MAG: hypothetical protein VKL42_00640 [Snowella sp.]|nr:hypothetical protein [Snowella sp.]